MLSEKLVQLIFAACTRGGAPTRHTQLDYTTSTLDTADASRASPRSALAARAPAAAAAAASVASGPRTTARPRCRPARPAPAALPVQDRARSPRDDRRRLRLARRQRRRGKPNRPRRWSAAWLGRCPTPDPGEMCAQRRVSRAKWPSAAAREGQSSAGRELRRKRTVRKEKKDSMAEKFSGSSTNDAHFGSSTEQDVVGADAHQHFSRDDTLHRRRKSHRA